MQVLMVLFKTSVNTAGCLVTVSYRGCVQGHVLLHRVTLDAHVTCINRKPNPNSYTHYIFPNTGITQKNITITSHINLMYE